MKDQKKITRELFTEFDRKVTKPWKTRQKKRWNVRRKKRIKALKFKQKKPNGIVYIQSTHNNTIITLTDLQGNTKYWASGGQSTTHRSTTYSSQAAAETVAKKALLNGCSLVNVQIKGLSRSKRGAVKGLSLAGLKILRIVDATRLPHNGCRPPKKRRT